NSVLGNFGISFSAGPDLSFVELNKPGKITLSYGVGLSYTFLKKLTLQSGFYVSRKLYSSDSADYHPPASFWQYNYTVDNIDANCKVYEVPISLLYNFKAKGKHQLYAGAGISTLFMKTESYDYTYKYFGQPYSRNFAISNENQHNFSMLTLTGGYQYNVSNRISVSASPYVKLPLTGIGFGKVQLKSGGIMFNATVKPFKKK
ncbi:MAG TPA: outer membrane beta-barrel protein, partial [Ferruginibacter sp.]|nr:outer membrane beta-barrel protein [Ferruginibacter sp.]